MVKEALYYNENGSHNNLYVQKRQTISVIKNVSHIKIPEFLKDIHCK